MVFVLVLSFEVGRRVAKLSCEGAKELKQNRHDMIYL